MCTLWGLSWTRPRYDYTELNDMAPPTPGSDAVEKVEQDTEFMINQSIDGAERRDLYSIHDSPTAARTSWVQSSKRMRTRPIDGETSTAADVCFLQDEHLAVLRGGTKTCAHCSTTKTPLWRNGPPGPKSLCNACGIRYNKIKAGKRKATPLEATYLGLESSLAPASPTISPSCLGRPVHKTRCKLSRQGSVTVSCKSGFDHLDGVKAAGYDPAAHPRKRSQRNSRLDGCYSSGSDEEGGSGSCVTRQGMGLEQKLEVKSGKVHMQSSLCKPVMNAEQAATLLMEIFYGCNEAGRAAREVTI